MHSLHICKTVLQPNTHTHTHTLTANLAQVEAPLSVPDSVIRLTVFLSPVTQLAFGFQLENLEVVVSILEQMLLHHDYGFDRSFTG